METLYTEGVAIHGGPELCRWRPARAQRSVDRGTRRPGLLSRECILRGAHAVDEAEGNTAGGVIASRWRTPRGRRTRACVELSSATRDRDGTDSPRYLAPCVAVSAACVRPEA